MRDGKKVLRVVSLMLIPLIAMMTVSGCDKKESIEILFFYFETCPSCNEYITAERLTEIIATLDARNRNISAVSRNCLNQEYMDELSEELEKRKIDDSLDFPILLVNDTYVTGYDAISKRIGRMILESD